MSRRFILYQGPWEWEFLWNRAQPLARALSAHGTVLYLSPGAPGTGQFPSRLVRRLPVLRRVVERWLVPRGLQQLSPTLWVQSWNWGILSPQQIGWSDYPPKLVGYLRTVVERLAEGHSERWLLTSRPAARALETLLPWDRMLGDIEDPWGDPNYPRYTPPESIAHLSQAADVIFGNGPAIAADFTRSLGRTVVDLPNGIDRSFLRGLEGAPRPAFFRADDRCRVVFTGNINERFDLGILRSVVARSRAVTFYFVGSCNVRAAAAADWRALRAESNVRIVPPIPHAEVPSALVHADALLLPYAPEHSRGMFPAKLYEYLAAGRPVLSTMDFGLKGPGTEAFRYCPSADLLAAAIGELLAGRGTLTEAERQAGRQLGERNTWDRRAETLIETVRNAAPRDRSEKF